MRGTCMLSDESAASKGIVPSVFFPRSTKPPLMVTRQVICVRLF
jgi:hypothetical protein